MLILIGLVVLAVVGYFLEKEGYDSIGFGLMLAGSVILLVAIIVLGVVHIEAKGQVAHYNEVLLSIDDMNDAEVSDSEIIVLSQKIIEVNTFIAEANAYNDGLLDIFIPNKVADLEPIRYNK